MISLIRDFCQVSEEEKRERRDYNELGYIKKGTPFFRGFYAALLGVTPTRGLSWQSEYWRRVWLVLFIFIAVIISLTLIFVVGKF